MKNKIVFIINSLDPIAGAEKMFKTVISNLTGYYDIHVIVFKQIKEIYIKEITFINLDLKWSSPFCKIKNIFILRNKIKEISPNNMISFIEKTNIMALLATLNCNCKKIVFEVTDPRREHLNKLFSFLYYKLYKIADIVLVNNKYVIDYLNTRDIVNTIYMPTPMLKPSIQDEVKKIESENYWLFLGRHHPVKGIERLVEAYSIANRENNLNSKLLIVGKEDPQASIRKMVNDLNLTEKVMLINEVQYHEVYLYIKNSKALVLSSYFEGEPNVIIESMILSKPVIVFKNVISLENDFDNIHSVLDIQELSNFLVKYDSKDFKFKEDDIEKLELFSLKNVVNVWRKVIDQ